MQPSAFANSIHPTLIREVVSRARPTSLHLGLGQPDLPLAAWARDALATYRDAPYTANEGRADLVNAISRRYDGDGVIVTVGTQEAIALVFLGLVEPGTDVLIPEPAFPVYPNFVRAVGANPVPYALGDRFALDPALVDAAWTDATSAIVLNSPSNPTGAVASADATRAVVELCETRGAFWISDEIYEDLVWVGEHCSPRSFGTNGVVLSGLSKSHSAMGLRIGWLAGPRETVRALIPLHQHLVACASGPSQAAAVAMLEHHDEQVRTIRETFARRRAVTLDRIARWGVPEPVLDGAFYAFVDMSGVMRPGETSRDLALGILDAVDVVTIPGSGFGASGEGYLRLAYTVEQDILTEALDRVGEFLQQRSTG